MKIAVIGCGAMGALYGGYLSRNNDVTLVERNPDRIAKIRADGLRIAEPDGSAAVYRPGITGDTSGMAPARLCAWSAARRSLDARAAGSKPARSSRSRRPGPCPWP